MRILLVLPAALALVGAAAAAHPARGGRRHSHRGPRRPAKATRPGKPIKIGFGFRPQVLVDEAGVAHITWSTQSEEHGPAGEHTYTAGWDNYCRLTRGANKCGDHTRFDAPIKYPRSPAEPGPFFENSPGANQDIGEGSLPLTTGNQLAILAHRPGNVVEVPGGTSEDVNFLWTSDDGGKTFTGPGLTSTMDYYGGAVAYGNPASIGIFGTTGELIQDSKTLAHVFFQQVRAGAYAPAEARVDLGRGANNLLARRQIAADGNRPIVAWDDPKDVTVREYKGKGDIDDASNWTTAKFPGLDPSLASGPHGTWLTYYPIGFHQGVVVKLADGHPSGPATPLFPPLLEGQEDQLAEAADGELVAAWTAKDSGGENYPRAMLSTSSDGRHWSKPQVLDDVGRHDAISGLQIAVGPDGGGVAVFVHGGTGNKVNAGTLFGLGGQVTAVPFGARGSTGKKGLGTKANGSAGCLDIRFGAVHAHVDSGCFLQLIDAKHRSGTASIAYGGVHVNGLEVRPDSPGTGIVIDDDAHTIESVGGRASILLQHPGVPDVRLWDGVLDARLGKKDNLGDRLFSMPMTEFHGNVLGFEILGAPSAILGKESVSIPVALKMPAYLGVTSSATLTADMTEGLVPSSLHITIPDITAVPGLALRGAAIDWVGPQEQWAGDGILEVPPGAGGAGLDVGTAIAFDHGEYASGGFATAPYPGTPVYRNAYLANFAPTALALHPPAALGGSGEIGAVAHGGGLYSLEATGSLRTAFGTPSRMEAEGEGAVYGVPLTSAHATFTTAGTFHETGVLGLDEGGLTIGGTLDGNTNLATGTTSGTIAGGFSFLGQSVEQSLPFNDTGFGYCKDVGPASVGFVFRWSGGVELHATGCAEALSGSGAG
jgi:hypothetical protein